MKTLAPFGFVLAPLAVVCFALGTLFLLTFGAKPAARSHPGPQAPSVVCPTLAATGGCPELVELEVRDVIPLKDAQTHAVVLVSKDRTVVLPIFVDESSAIAIAFRLAHRAPPQPMSQDLLDHVVTQLGGEVTGVRIDDVHEHMLSTHVFIRQGGRYLGLDARPSDAVAMALTRGAKIFATHQVMEQAGITRKEIEDLRKQQQQGVGGAGQDDEQLAPPRAPGAPDKEITL